MPRILHLAITASLVLTISTLSHAQATGAASMGNAGVTTDLRRQRAPIDPQQQPAILCIWRTDQPTPPTHIRERPRRWGYCAVDQSLPVNAPCMCAGRPGHVVPSSG